MISVHFTPWGHFHARKQPDAIRHWLHTIGEAGTNAFRAGMPQGSKKNRSAPGAWPHSQSGRLKGSINFIATDNEVTIGTNTHYSNFLRQGTSKMARRKMSDNALEEGMKSGRLLYWVEWVRG